MFPRWHPLEPLVVAKKGRAAKETESQRSSCGELEVRLTLRRGTGNMQKDAVAEAEAARWFVDDTSSKELRHASHAANTLQVAVVRAINLIVADSEFFGGKSDPFVTLTVNSFRVKSWVVRKNLNPVWMQTFDVPFQWDGGVPPVLRVLVEDWDYVGSPDFLGCIDVQPISLPKVNSDGSAPAKWYTLEGRGGGDDSDSDADRTDRGQLQLAIKMVYDPANDPSEDRPFFDELIEEKHLKKLPNELRIAVCRAEGVKAMDVPLPFSSKPASSDPYVIVRVNSRPEKKTQKRMGTLTPVWNEVFVYDLHAEDLVDRGAGQPQKTKLGDATIEVLMWDWDRLDLSLIHISEPTRPY